MTMWLVTTSGHRQQQAPPEPSAEHLDVVVGVHVVAVLTVVLVDMAVLVRCCVVHGASPLLAVGRGGPTDPVASFNTYPPGVFPKGLLTGEGPPLGSAAVAPLVGQVTVIVAFMPAL